MGKFWLIWSISVVNRLVHRVVDRINICELHFINYWFMNILESPQLSKVTLYQISPASPAEKPSSSLLKRLARLATPRILKRSLIRSSRNIAKHATLWLCQNSFAKWLFIVFVDLPIENGGSFHSYVKLPEGKQ